MSEEQSEQNNFLSLSEASGLTGYHPDYLGFLARTGKLQAQKIGRNWVTTKFAVDELMKQMNKVMSLAEASEISGYHQDYLGALARNGKLQAQKIGRNWVTTRFAIY